MYTTIGLAMVVYMDSKDEFDVWICEVRFPVLICR